MLGYILTETQKKDIQEKEYAPYQCFNCVMDINGIWFTFCTPEEEFLIAETDYAWLLKCPTGEFVPPISPLFPNE